MKGKVKFFNEGKHFGFINGDDGKDYFVHSSQIVDQVTLAENDEVEFEGEEGDRGLVAKDVKRV
jgi:cold shock protein